MGRRDQHVVGDAVKQQSIEDRDLLTDATSRFPVFPRRRGENAGVE